MIRLPLAIFTLLASIVPTACMTVTDSETLSRNFQSKDIFQNKRIAILPVSVAQRSVSTDSVVPLKSAIHDRLDQTIKSKLPASQVITTKKSAELISAHIDQLDQLFTTYDKTGVFDRKAVTSLGAALQADYLVVSHLKAEKLDMAWIMKGIGTSLETYIVDVRRNEVAWSGVGEFKAGGIYTFGDQSAGRAATELVTLAFKDF